MESISHYQSVIEFNKAFEVKVYEGPEDTLFQDNLDLVNRRYNLVEEEVSELEEAFQTKNYVEFVDALADILYVAYGMIIALNLRPVTHMQELLLQAYNKTMTSKKTLFEFCVDYKTGTIVDRISLLSGYIVGKIHLKDVNQLSSTLCDIIKKIYDSSFELDIDINKAFSIVHESNMSKLCSSEEEAKETVAYYKSIDKADPKYYDSPTYRESKTPGKWIIYNASTTKILKNINYKAADLRSLCVTN